MNLLQIIAYLVAAFQKYGPVLAAAVAAYDTGGWAGLEKYLLSLINTPVAGGPTKAEAQGVLDKLKSMRGAKTAAAAPATCCPADGCCCCLKCAECKATETLLAIVSAQCCDDCPATK